MKDTKQQFEHVIAICRDLFAKKLHDYGAAWRIMRPSSVTDQIFIKANRIRSIETKGVAMVDEGIRSEFIAIVNYGIIGLVQLELGYAETDDMTEERALELYDRYAKQALELMLAKNHDYDEAWRSMRVSSYTDLILMPPRRIGHIHACKRHHRAGACIGRRRPHRIRLGIDKRCRRHIRIPVYGSPLKFFDHRLVFFRRFHRVHSKRNDGNPPEPRPFRG